MLLTEQKTEKTLATIRTQEWQESNVKSCEDILREWQTNQDGIKDRIRDDLDSDSEISKALETSDFGNKDETIRNIISECRK